MCSQDTAHETRATSAAVVSSPALAEKVEALRSPSTFSEATTAVDAIETHFAWVFLVGDYAYKLKKPVEYPGMDLRELAARRSSCEEEVQLNQALAPHVYLGTMPLVRGKDDRLHVGGEGVVVDWLVRMRRLPAAAMLDRALVGGRASLGTLATVGVKLARFYNTRPRVIFTPEQYRRRIAEQIRADAHALLVPELHLDAVCVQTALDAMWRAFALLEPELGQRASEDRIVEAHGDLRPEHICLEPPCVIDSLEFSKDLRTLDPAEELAFLWIECEQAGDLEPARSVLTAYRCESRDPISERLLDFYRSRRALVRAKIVAWHLCDPDVMNAAPWRSRAETYVARAERYAQRAVVSVSFGAAG